MLQDMDTFRFFKEFMFPIDMESLRSFLKQNDSTLHTKSIKNLMVFEKLFTDYDQVEQEKLIRERGMKGDPQFMVNEPTASNEYEIEKILQDSDLRKHIQNKFSTHFSMGERKQTQVMKSWLEFMIEEYVNKESKSLLNKLRNSQVLMLFAVTYLSEQLAIECKEKSQVLQLILQLYFSIFSNYENVIEARVENKKKNILLKEQEKIATEYKAKYEKSMNEIHNFQKKLNETNSKHRKLSILYDNLKERYSRLAHLLERVKSNNYDSLLKVAKEHANYASMMSSRRFIKSKRSRRIRHGQSHKLKFSSRAVTKVNVTNNSVTETDEQEYSKDFDIEVEAEDDEEVSEKYSFLNKSLRFKPLPKRSRSHKNFTYNKLVIETEESMIKTVAETISEVKPTADAKIQTDDVELYKI